MGGGSSLTVKDEVVSRLSVRVLAPSPAPRALTGLVEVEREVGGPVEVVPPACLHPGRGVGEDVDVVIVEGVHRPRARLEPLAHPGLRVAEKGEGAGARLDAGGLGMRRAHVPVRMYPMGSPEPSPPRCPTHQSVRR